MNQLFKVILILAVIVALVFGARSLLPNRKKAALSVNTTPKATVFLDGEHLGQTPYYNEKLKAGEYILKIVPESSGQALNPWEGRVNLSAGILTAVTREMGLTQDTSSGEILSFETLADKNAVSISVVTTPDGAVVHLNGEPKGFAPLSIDGLTEGDHTLTISSPGYKEKTVNAKAVKGHKLIASIQLAREPLAVDTEEEAPEATTSASPSPKASPTPSTSGASPSPISTTETPTPPYIEINSPGTGWARVREEATTGSTELAKVDHESQFSLLETTTAGGYDWFKIEYATGKQGWIREDLADKVE